VRTLFVSLIAVVALTTPSVAAALPHSFPPSALRASSAIPVAQYAQPNSGKVTEALAVGTYTYLHVTKDGKDAWLAIPRRDVAVGAEVQYGDGAVMKDFHSKTLNRTFAEVMFLEGVTVAGETTPAMPSGHPPVQASETPNVPAGHPPVPADQAAVENLPNVGKVKESIAAGSYTYLRIAGKGDDEWVAIPRQDVPVGAEVRYAEGMMMKDFHSRSLDRTFAEVMFLGGVLVTGQ